jgi:hypothetical protein
MRTFSQFVQLCEAIYDTDKPSDVPLEVGRISTTRKKTAPERRRTKRLGGGKVGPAKEYKPRSDIGTQRQASTRVQQPTKERGSADVKAAAAAAAKEERKKAAQARIAAKKSGESATTEKPRAKTLEKKASALLSKKEPAKAKTTGEPEDHMIKGKYTRGEKKQLVRAGKRLHRDLAQGVDKPASHYKP